MPLLERYFSVCRRYADRLGDQPADRLYQLLCAPYFYRLHRFVPRFRTPTTFTEAVWNKMLFDRDPRLKTLADKFASRAYIASRVGEEYLIPLLWHGDDPEQIPFSQLPSSYVIKASHGSGFNLFVSPAHPNDPQTIKTTVRSWLARDYCLTNCVGSEWAYRSLAPTIVIEPLLSDGSGAPLPDFKLHCFGGKVGLIQIDLARATNHVQSIHDRAFRRLDVRFTYPPAAAQVEKPECLEQLVTLAENLAANFRLLRVDFYLAHGRILIGELTNYPGGGRTPVRPRSFDRNLMSMLRGSRT
jgi:hypothetical protein